MSDLVIDNFSGEYRWLSNFWPCDVFYQGLQYPSSEHAYQAAKTNIQEQRETIRCLTAGQAKRYGTALELPISWEKEKLIVMETILFEKFRRNSDLKEQLRLTGDLHLIEGNTWNDQFWGICDGKGKNHLGKILMKIRRNL